MGLLAREVNLCAYSSQTAVVPRWVEWLHFSNCAVVKEGRIYAALRNCLLLTE